MFFTMRVSVLCLAAAGLQAQSVTPLVTFDRTNGSGSASLAQAASGLIYGVTRAGGSSVNGGPCGSSGCGTAFKMTLTGTLTTLYNFSGSDGSGPQGLTLATNGDFYGNAGGGGALNEGLIFKLTPAGSLSQLASFDGTDGISPIGALVQATNGSFYGATLSGGANTCFSIYQCGAVFKVTPSGSLSAVASFNGSDGFQPLAGLIQATDCNFYGTTDFGGANAGPYGQGAGAVFKMTPAGKLTTLYSFCAQANCSDGMSPAAELVEGPDGSFYGTTQFGGVTPFCTG